MGYLGQVGARGFGLGYLGLSKAGKDRWGLEGLTGGDETKGIMEKSQTTVDRTYTGVSNKGYCSKRM